MWLLFIGFCCAYFITKSLYRLYLHPLRHFPGPKVAAITHAYEFYHDVIRRGMYIWEIERMHQKYGPVVRISPRELHIKDSHYYDEIYAPASKKREKDPNFVGAFGFPSSMISTVGHDLHRFRRGLLNNYFSKKSVNELWPMLQEKESKLMQRFEKAHKDNTVLQLDDAFSALTADIITQYSWGVSAGLLDDENFKKDIRQIINDVSNFFHVNRFFPVIATILRAMPRWFLGAMRPATKAVLDMQDLVVQQSTAEKSTVGSSGKTIFDALGDPSVPPAERSPGRLEDEGLVLMVAGTEATARTLTLAAFHLYHQNKLLLQKIREELRPLMPTPTTEVSWPQLEQLPYLNGVVNEAVRLAYGPIFRSPRVAPTDSLRYKDLVIPPGSPVSMSSYFVCTDPEVFPSPESFKPERWIQATEQGQNLSKYLVAFNRGSRICVGMNLALAELFMTIAAVVRRFDLELYETAIDNIRIHRELGIGQPKEGPFSVRAKITSIIKE